MTNAATTASSADPARPPRSLNPLRLLLGLFSSVWFGITLMVLIFIYSSIGSSGVPNTLNVLKWIEPTTWVNVRELIEMSEFRWFHWWPFDLLIALFCINLTVTTIRRIPFNVVNLGVWMIHAGLIILAIGSVIYFTLKREGDTIVPRREVVINAPGHEPTTMIAAPGNTLELGEGPDAWRFTISNIDPEWEMLSEGAEGVRTYKVSVRVEQGGRTFIRQLSDGYPETTQDLVRSDDPAQPFVRQKTVNGELLADASVDITMRPAETDVFYLMESRSIYVREKGETEWVQRPVIGMPFFKDHVSEDVDIWPQPDLYLPRKPIEVPVKAKYDGDPIPDDTIVIDEYLRYASLRERIRGGGDTLDPVVNLEFTSSGRDPQAIQLEAFTPGRDSERNGAIQFRWAATEAEAANLLDVQPPRLTISVPGREPFDVEVGATSDANPSLAFIDIEGTPLSYRVRAVQNELQIGGIPRPVSVAIVEFRSEDETFERWVFDDPALNRDVREGESIAMHTERQTDERVAMVYLPGDLPTLRVVAGPEPEQLRASIPQATGGSSVFELEEQSPLILGPGLSMTVTGYTAFADRVERPVVIPYEQRDSDVGWQASMVQVSVPRGDGTFARPWLTFHQYPFDRPQDVLRRFRYMPTEVELADGRTIELLFSRRRASLPNPVSLDRFEVVSHIGGFTGETSSIRDWRSSIQFIGDDGSRSDAVAVHMNNPKESGGYWFFQSMWDPPDPQPRFTGDPGSAGLNYTVLGVGNRHGVMTQLIGCIISCIGMCYAFYVKPWIKRRRQQAVYAQVAAVPAGAAAASPGAGARPDASTNGTGDQAATRDRDVAETTS